MIRSTCILLAGVALLGGCADYVCPETDEPIASKTLLAYNNINARRIPRIWAYAKVRLELRKNPWDLPFIWGSVSEHAEPNARLFLTKTNDGTGPQDMLLQLRETGMEMGRVGISTADGVYYLWVNAGRMKRCIYGRLGRTPADGSAMQINPVDLMDLLTVTPLSAETTPVDAVISSKPCAYLLPQRMVAGNRRELFFDRRVPNPTLPYVYLDGKWARETVPPSPGRLRLSAAKVYDLKETLQLEASIDEYSPLVREDVPEKTPTIWMPKRLELHWPESGTKMTLVLEDVTTADKVDPEAYYFWERLPSGFASIAQRVDVPTAKEQSK